MNTTTAQQSYQTGDILYARWGSAIVEFYEVVRATAKTVWLREVRSQRVGNYGRVAQVVALPGEYTGEEIVRRRVQNGGLVRLDARAYASRWDGEPKYEDAYC